jgi:import inner membrane translocase subunit TIM44
MLAARQAFRSTLPRAVLLRQTAASHRLPTNAISVATLPRLVDAWRSSHSRRTFAVASKQQENTKEGDSSKAETAPDKEKKPSLEEAVHRIQGDDAKKGTSASSTGGGIPTDDLLRSAADYWSSFQTEVGQTWQDLISSEERRSINKKIRPVATAEGDAPYAGPVEVMVIDPSEHLTAWERMQRRLTDAPVIQDVLARTEEFYEKSGARKVKDRVDEVTEDAREAWETSQNPWVYRMSSVYDTLTAETPESIAVKELRQLDPEFTLDDWRRNVVEHTLPQIMQWFLEGRINQLKDWLGEGVFKRIAAEITARKQEGVEIDTHVLSIMNSEILAIEVSVETRVLLVSSIQLECRRK